MKINKINKHLFMALGIVSTFAALQIDLGINLAIYNHIVIAIILVNLFCYEKNFKIRSISLLLLNVIYIISLIFNSYLVNGLWMMEAIRFILKNILLLVLVTVVRSDRLTNYWPVFLKGLYISTIIQLIWEYIEIIYWYVFKRSLNSLVFGDMLGIQASNGWITYHGMFRPMGLSWESANLSMALIMGFILSKNTYMKILFFLSVFLGGSRTGIIGMMVALMVTLVLKFKNKKVLISREKIMELVAGIVVVSSAIVIMANIADSFTGSIILPSAINSLHRISAFLSRSDISSNRHLEYITKLPEIFTSYSPHHIIIGFGTTSAGLFYTLLFGWNSSVAQWSPESDFINILVGNGVIGIGCYYHMLYKVYKKNRENNEIKTIIIVICICGFLYAYIRSWIMLIVALLSVVRTKSNEEMRKLK